MGRGTESGDETQWPLLDDGFDNVPRRRSKTVPYIIVGAFLCSLLIGAFVIYGILKTWNQKVNFTVSTICLP